jgi:predicted aconitase
MKLTKEEQALLDGEQGEVMQKVMRTITEYGKIFGADSLKDVQGAPHMVISFGIFMIKPYFRMIEELLGAGLKAFRPFTVDPKPYDMKNLNYGLLEKISFKYLYSKQKKYENQLKQLGLKDDLSFTCACYLPEIGNIPSAGEILAWSESSAVVYANSVLGARSNRLSAGIDLLCNIAGKTPNFGLLTDEGRKATWHIHIKTTKQPNAQLLGSAIGLKVSDEVPYISGLSDYLGDTISDTNTGYLKDLGAAAASNGAVGLFHVENLTPEAKEQGASLLAEGYQEYIIDDAELEGVQQNYPSPWEAPEVSPQLAMIGCPHLTLNQLQWWTNNLAQSLTKHNQKKLGVETVLFAPAAVIDTFKEEAPETFRTLIKAGARFTYVCPLMYVSNPISARKKIITCSNKLRTYSKVKYFREEELLEIILSGKTQ